MAIGLAASWALALRHAPYYGISTDRLEKLLMISVISALISAHGLYVIQYPEQFENPILEFFLFFESGKIWYGGFLGGILALTLYAKFNKESMLKYTDYLSPYVALAHAIGRIGCFLNGCCYGKPNQAWGMQFPGMAQPVIPTQLISSAFLFMLFFILLRLRKKLKNTIGSGIVFAIYLLIYSCFRFLIEFIRGDNVPVYTGLRFSQWVSILLFMIGVFILWRAKRIFSK